MPEPYFIFKGVDSRDMGILVNELPSPVRISRDMNKITVPGRDGFLTDDPGTYGGIVKSCQCTLLDINNIDPVLVWLDGSGDIIFSNQTDRKYKASIMNQIPFDRIMRQWYKFVVIFDCQPFGLALNNDMITLVSPGIFYNMGNYKSRPIINVYGTGSIDLTINNNVIHLTNVDGYITIDSELMDCHKDTILTNSSMLGDFPELIVGENSISWIGTVSKVEITPNWRFV